MPAEEVLERMRSTAARGLDTDPDEIEGQVVAIAFDYPNGHRLEYHSHRRGQVVYASGGVMTVSAPQGTWVVPAQRAVWVPAGIPHAIRMSGAVTMRTVYLATGVGERFPDRCNVVAVSNLLRELILRSVEVGPILWTQDGGPPSHPSLLALLLEELMRAHEAPVVDLHLRWPTDPRALRVAEALAADPGDRRGRAEWCPVAGASGRTLARLFLAETGLSFSKWRQQLRLQSSLELLAQGRSVTETAGAVGYDSVSAFITMFRLATGHTPTALVASMKRID